MPSPPPEQIDFPSPIVLNSNELPANFVALTRTPASSASRLEPLSYEANNSGDGRVHTTPVRKFHFHHPQWRALHVQRG